MTDQKVRNLTVQCLSDKMLEATGIKGTTTETM